MCQLNKCKNIQEGSSKDVYMGTENTEIEEADINDNQSGCVLEETMEIHLNLIHQQLQTLNSNVVAINHKVGSLEKNLKRVQQTEEVKQHYSSTPLVSSEMSMEDIKTDNGMKKWPTVSSSGDQKESNSFGEHQLDISPGAHFDHSQKDVSGFFHEKVQKISKIENELKAVQLSWDLEMRHIRQNMDILRNEINMCKKF